MGSHAAHMVPTADGRELEVLVSGPQDGFPLVFHHWTPGAAVPLGILERPATDRGFRVIAYSRPGCGRSTPRLDAATTATVADDAGDTAAILDHLGLGQFVTVAWSGGGPRGLACAAMLPDRCRAVATLAGPVPPDAEGIDPLAGMRPENLVEYAAARQGTDVLTALLEQQVAPLRSATDDQIVEALRAQLGPVDQAALTGELGAYLAACMRHSVHQGIVGWRDDTLTYTTRPWGFNLGRIRVPVSVWHGTEDGNLGSVHGVWLGEHVAGARLHLVKGEGHISLVLKIDQVLDEVVEQAGLQLRPSSPTVIT
jgi:pimeloyl-ACP methyl ester carboxylesterase